MSFPSPPRRCVAMIPFRYSFERVPIPLRRPSSPSTSPMSTELRITPPTSFSVKSESRISLRLESTLRRPLRTPPPPMYVRLPLARRALVFLFWSLGGGEARCWGYWGRCRTRCWGRCRERRCRRSRWGGDFLCHGAGMSLGFDSHFCRPSATVLKPLRLFTRITRIWLMLSCLLLIISKQFLHTSPFKRGQHLNVVDL